MTPTIGETTSISAYNHFYYLEENQKAAEILEQCMQFDGAPRYMPRLVARLRSESSNLGAARLFLQELHQNAESDEERASYQSALDEIEVETKARILDQARVILPGALSRQGHRRSARSRHGPPADAPRSSPVQSRRSSPPTRRKGDDWYIDSKTGQITSSYYGRRYRLNATAQSYEWSGDSSAVESTHEESGGEEI